MLNMSEADRHYLLEIRSIGIDSEGKEALVGLTAEESQWYLDYSKRGLTKQGPGSQEDTDKYFALHNRHQLMRLQIIGAEAESRQNLIKH